MVDESLFCSMSFLYCDLVFTINLGINFGSIEKNSWVDSNLGKREPLRCFSINDDMKDERVSDMGDELSNFGQH